MGNRKIVRLTDEEIRAIKDTAKQVFGDNVRVWLFGSRVNPDAKGGDIDIYIEAPQMENRIENKISYLVKLKEKIGDQKIDLILKPFDCQDDICIEAKKTGVRIV